MRKTLPIIGLMALLLLPALLRAQFQEMQVSDESGYKTLIPEEKQALLKNVSMIANMRFGFLNEFYGENTSSMDYVGSRFKMEQFRLEIRGMVFKKVYFRFRDRYTKTQSVQSVDNLLGSVDLAYIRVDATPKLSISMGKMCADWGGYEFDYNPIDIYEYADIVEMADNFLAGVGVSYQAFENHQFSLQVLNSRTRTFEELYGEQPGKVEAKAPLAFVANWRGSFFGGKFNTIWSYAIHTEARNTFMNYIALGNQLKIGKFLVEYDYKLSGEDLDRTGIVSNTVPDSLYPWALENCIYQEHWLHIAYRVSPKINLAFVGMLDYAKWKDDLDPQKTSDEIRTAWGYIPTIEYYPWEQLNIRFYVNWIGRIYKYSDYAENRFGAVDSKTGRVTIGFVSPLAIF
jgi:hypothetical protein